MNTKSIRMNNKGFSLVELIVVVLITGILMLTVGIFMSTSRNVFQTVNISSTLQEEAMTLERIISEELMEAEAIGCWTGSLSSKPVTVLWVNSKDNTKVGRTDTEKIYYVVLVNTTGKVYFCETNASELDFDSGLPTSSGISTITTKCMGTNAKYNLLAEHVKSFTLIHEQMADGSYLINIPIEYNYMDTEYKANITAVLRNRNSGRTVY